MQLNIYVALYLYFLFCSIDLCLSLCSYHATLIIAALKQKKSSNLFFFKGVLAILSPLYFHINFRISLSISKIDCRALNWGCNESMDQSGGNDARQYWFFQCTNSLSQYIYVFFHLAMLCDFWYMGLTQVLFNLFLGTLRFDAILKGVFQHLQFPCYYIKTRLISVDWHCPWSC